MNQMKHLHYALLPIVALAFASCSEDLEEFESPKAELEGKFYKQYEITADCSFNDPETRAVLENDAKVNWEDIDKLIIWTGEARDGGNYTVSEANMGEFTRTTKNGVNTFYGYLKDTELESEPADDTPLYAYVASEYIEPVYVTSNYQGNWDNETQSWIYDETMGFLCADLSEQDGTMEDAMKHDLLWATLPYSDFKNNKIPNVQFEHEMSILKYTLTLEGAGNTTADIRLSGFGMAKKVNFKVTTGKGRELHNNGILLRQYDMIEGDIMLRSVEVKNDVATVYVALYPSWFEEVQAYVTLADGRRATASVGGDLNEYPIEYTLEAGKIYTASAVVEPVTVTAKVGDYFNSDGTYTAEPQSNSIGIVFSTETTARDFAAGYTNGYVMALMNATGPNPTGTNSGDGVNWDSKYNEIPELEVEDIPGEMGGCWYYNRDGRYETNVTLKSRADNGNQGCEAAYAAYTFQPIEGYVKTPGTSDWFLPSFSQWYEIITKLGGMNGGEYEELQYHTEHLPYNLAYNNTDLDKLLTFNEKSAIWRKRDEAIDWEQSYSYKFRKNMNERLEIAEQAGASVHLFLIENRGLHFWTSATKQNGGMARHVSFFSSPEGDTSYNGYIFLGQYCNKGRGGFLCGVRPVLAF